MSYRYKNFRDLVELMRKTLIFISVLFAVFATSTNAGIVGAVVKTTAKVAVKNSKVAVTQAGKAYIKNSLKQAPKLIANNSKPGISSLRQYSKNLTLKTLSLARAKKKYKKSPNRKNQENSASSVVDLLTEIDGLAEALASHQAQAPEQPNKIMELDPKLKLLIKLALAKSFSQINGFMEETSLVEEDSKTDLTQLVQTYQKQLDAYLGEQ